MAKSTRDSAIELVREIKTKHRDNPAFALVMKYNEECVDLDTVVRPYDWKTELLGLLQDPQYSEINVPFRRWFPLAVLSLPL